MARLWQMVGWRRLAVTGMCLVIWRLLEQIPVAALNPTLGRMLFDSTDTSDLIHTIGSALPLARYSVITMGIAPFINAWLAMSLVSVISERMRAIGRSPEGELRLKLWTRTLAIVLALAQAYSWTLLMDSPTTPPQMMAMDWATRLAIVLQLAGGTMLLVFLADTLDEFGLGFGAGAVLIYALTPLANEVHRLANLFARTPSVEALYRPFGIWVAFSIALVVATVAVMRAVRRVPGGVAKDARSSKPVELGLLMSGILRPAIFAAYVLSLPLIIARTYAESSPRLAQWIYQVTTPYGPSPWTNLAYVALDASLVIAFTYFVVVADFGRSTLPRSLIAHIYRLSLVGGIFLAITDVLVPVMNRLTTQAGATPISLSGFDVILVAAILLKVVGALDRSNKRAGNVQVLTSRLP